MSLVSPIIVHVDPDLEAIIPRFLANQQKAVAAMQQAWAAQDYDTLRALGHKMKGAAGGYGFDVLTEFGRTIEDAAKASNALPIQQALKALDAYLDRVEVVYA